MRSFILIAAALVFSGALLVSQSSHFGHAGHFGDFGAFVDFEIAGRKVEFVRHKVLHLMISKECQVGPHTFKCQAYESLQTASL